MWSVNACCHVHVLCCLVPWGSLMSANSGRLLNKTDITETSNNSSSCSKQFKCSSATSLIAILQSFHFSAAMLVAVQLSPKWNNYMYIILSLGSLAFLAWKKGYWKLQFASCLSERLQSDPPALSGCGGGCQGREQGHTEDIPNCCQHHCSASVRQIGHLV